MPTSPRWSAVLRGRFGRESAAPCAADGVARPVRGGARHRARRAAMRCVAFEMLSAGVDGGLSEHESHGVQAHLATCERCRALRAELVLLKASVRDGALAQDR